MNYLMIPGLLIAMSFVMPMAAALAVGAMGKPSKPRSIEGNGTFRSEVTK